jgi:hypothetical protein
MSSERRAAAASAGVARVPIYRLGYTPYRWLRPVQFELLPDARCSLLAWLERRGGTVDDYAFPSRIDHNGHISTHQYARLVDEWVTGVA